MSVNYHDILAATSLRVNGLLGADVDALEAAYIARPLTTAQFNSTIFPFSDFRTAILSAEQKLAQVIALSNDESQRAYLMTQTAALSSGDALPKLDSAEAPIIGPYGAVMDGVDPAIVCTLQPVQVVRRYNAYPTLWPVPVYYFAIVGNRIEHTRTTVVLECPVYDYGAQVTAFDADGDMVLADGLMEALICGGISMLVRDDEFMEQAKIYVTYFNDTLESFKVAKAA